MKKLLLTILFFSYTILSFGQYGAANEGGGWNNSEYNTTEGTDFWVTYMFNYGNLQQDVNLKLYLYAVAREKTTFRIQYADGDISKIIDVPAGGRSEIFTVDQSKAYITDPDTKMYKGMHVISEKPISLYALNQNAEAGSYDATNILPTKTLGREYVIQTYSTDGVATEFALLGTENGTSVEINYYEKHVETGQVTKKDTSIFLNKGETFLHRSSGIEYSLTGTTICTNYPMAVFCGGQHADIPRGSSNKNHIYSQLYPVTMWGKHFVVQNIHKHKKDFYRVTAAQNGTILKINGTQVATLNSNQTYDGVVSSPDHANKADYIETNKNALVCFYGTDGVLSNDTIPDSENPDNPFTRNYEGAPAMAPVIPMELGCNDLIFATLKSSGISKHYVNIVTYKAYKSGMRLDGEDISGQFTDLGTTLYSYAQIQLTDGAHTLKNILGNTNTDAVFTTMVYGLGMNNMGRQESYAYAPGSRILRDVDMLINKQYIKEKTICIAQPLTFTALIGGDYSSVMWNFHDYGGTTSGSSSLETTHTFSSAGDYDVTLTVGRQYPINCTNTSGTIVYDTVHAVIHVKNNYTAEFNRKICEGQTVELKGRDENGDILTCTYATNTNEEKKFFTVDGCDSIVRVHIEVGYPETKYYTRIECNEFWWHGTCYTESGEHTWKTENEYGCEVTESLDLTILKPVVGPVVEKTICSNSDYTWNGQQVDHNGIYTATLKAANGCDSIAQINVKIEDEYREELTEKICYGTPYKWRGKKLTEAKMYEEKTKSPNGCDSTFILNLSFYPDYRNIQVTAETCEDKPYRFGDTLLTTSGTYTKPFTSLKGGCDSIVTLTLTVWPLEYDTLYEEICQGDSFFFDNRHLLKDGKYIKTEKDAHGCTKTTVLDLTVHPMTYATISPQICAEELPYRADPDGKLRYSGGTYIDTLKNRNQYGCDSILTVHLKVFDEIRDTIHAFRCANEAAYSYLAEPDAKNFQNLTDEKLYYDTLYTDKGCMRYLVLDLKVGKTYDHNQYATICDNESFSFHGHIFENLVVRDEPYPFDSLLKTVQGCDSMVHFFLSVKPTYDMPTENITICESDDDWSWHISDSHDAYTVEVKKHDLEQQPYTTTLNYTLKSIHNCDSIVHRNLTINPNTIKKDTVLWCASQGPYMYGEKGKMASQSGDYTDTLLTRNRYGCDSILYLNLTILDSIYFYDTIKVCDNQIEERHGKLFVGDKFEIWGGTYNVADYDSVRIYSVGSYSDTIHFKTIQDCDSVYYLTIHILPTHYSEQERNICQFEETTYEAMHNGVGGIVPSNVLGEMRFVDTIPAIGNGCDSIIHMTYHVRPHYHFSQGDTVVCQVYEGEWTWYNENGDPQMTIPLTVGDTLYTLGKKYETVYGCDSTYGITVYVAPIYHIYEERTLCESDSLSWQGILFTGQEFANYHPDGYDASQYRRVRAGLVASSTDYLDTAQYYTAAYGCDSVYHLTLRVNRVYRTTIERRSCQTPDGYYYECLNRGKGGIIPALHLADSLTRNDTISTIDGCDSIITLHYYVDSVYNYGISYIFCQDTIDPMKEWVDEEEKSHGFVLDISRPGDFKISQTFTTIHGCDSIYGVTWHVDPSHHVYDTIHMCENSRMVWQNTRFTGDSVRDMTIEDTIMWSPGIYHEFRHYETVAGCDSDYYATIYVHPIYDTLTQITICESDGFVWRQEERPWGEYNSYADSLCKVAYCDTIRLLPHEALLPQPARDTTMRYAERMLSTIYGCDSLSRILVTVKPTYFFLSDTTICANNYVKYRNKFFSSKDTIYTEKVSTKDGCDSIYQLRLHVRPTFMNVRRVTICDNETLFHKSINKDDVVWGPGDEIRDPEWEYYDMIYTDKNGCDSIYRYYLTIYPAYLFEDTIQMCSSDSVILHGNHYVGERIVYPTEIYVEPYTTIYDTVFKTIHNCDSVYRINATIYPTYYHRDTIVICDDGEATWRAHHYVGNMFGNVLGDGLPVGDHVFFDNYKTVQHGCDSIYELLLRVLPTYLMIDSLSKCVNDAMTWHGQKLDVLPLGEHFFFDSLTTKSGCDSVYHLYLTVLDTTFEVRYDTICETEYYDLHGRKIGTAGTYKDTIPNAWGCNHYTYLHLHVIPPTYYWLNIPELCADDSIMEIGYDYIGRDLIEYSIYFDSLAHAQGFVDIVHEPITDIPNQIIEIPVPYGDTLPRPGKPYFDTWQAREHYSYASKYAYPRPDHYSMRVVMHNGICQDPIQSKDTTYDILYPSWIHEQHWNDGIVLFNELYNGGYEFEKYQWYHNGRPIIGQTREFLYWPDSLGINDPQDFYVDEYNHKRCLGDEYRVLLTRKGENYGIFTCPICPVHVYDRLVPTEDFFSVVPTLVVKDYPYVWILATKPVHYTIYNIDGARITHGYVKLSREHYEEQIYLGKMEKEGIVTMVLRTDDGEERKFKIMVVYENSRPPYSIR